VTYPTYPATASLWQAILVSAQKISSASLQFVHARVAAMAGGTPYNLDTTLVSMAFTVDPDEPASFYYGTWQVIDGRYVARVLVGPGGTVELPPGVYSVWVRVEMTPEVPVLLAGSTQVL
jgi:hypothetical protein